MCMQACVLHKVLQHRWTHERSLRVQDRATRCFTRCSKFPSTSGSDNGSTRSVFLSTRWPNITLLGSTDCLTVCTDPGRSRQSLDTRFWKFNETNTNMRMQQPSQCQTSSRSKETNEARTQWEQARRCEYSATCLTE